MNIMLRCTVIFLVFCLPASAADVPDIFIEYDKSTLENGLPGQFETGRAVLGSMLSNQRFDRDDDYVESLSQKYGSLDLGDVHDAADVVIKANRLTWLIVGDREKIESELRALELGPVSIMDADGNIVE